VASAGLLQTPAQTAKPAQGGLLGGLTGNTSSSQNSGLPLLNSPLPTLCILCTPAPTLPVPTPTLPVPTPCVLNCPPTQSPGCTSNCGTGNGGGNSGNQTTATPAPGTVTGTAPGSTGGNSGSGSGGSGGTAVNTTPGAITIQPPPAVETLSPVAGISFGKAPFLWPLFIALDFLGLGAVVLVLRKTWSKPVTD
jgi:hypothetical protein